MATVARRLSQVPTPIAGDSVQKAKEGELHTSRHNVHVEFEKFYGTEPRRVDRRFDLSLLHLTYLPKVDDPYADWVVTAALNAFKTYESGGFGRIHRFATIGTGSGTDVIAALDTFFELEDICMTDIHDEVVKIAKTNVLPATEKVKDSVKGVAERAVAEAGDLLLPLENEEPFDLVYENLPDNITDLGDGQASSTYLDDRSWDKVPSSVSSALLELHYICLVQAKSFGLLRPSGVILSSMGGRVSTNTMLELADVAGYSGRILTVWWKAQSEPESVIGGYAEHEQKGLGPLTNGTLRPTKFYFYPTSALEQAFIDRTPAEAGLHATRIMKDLLPHCLNAIEALQKYREGVRIGHIVIVMASVLKSASSRRH